MSALGPAVRGVAASGVLHHDLPPRYARFLNNATHWGFRTRRGRRLRADPGQATHAEGLVRTAVRRHGLGLRLRRPPSARRLEPIWKYDLETLGKDLSAHLVFGTATAAAFSVLVRKESS